MRIPVFGRILLGYSAILLLSVGLSAYSSIQLGNLSTTARAALETDTRRITTIEALTDAFLSEVRYAGRFIITHSDELYDQYRQFHSDFARYMKELQTISTPPEIQSRLGVIADLHSRYTDLFDREVKYIRGGQPYGESRYKQEKQKVFESTLRQLELLKTLSQNNLETNLKGIEHRANKGRLLTIITTLLLVAVGFAVSYNTSKSITAPLVELQRNTAAPNVYTNANPAYSRIPEIQRLSEALARAKDHLHVSYATNAEFVHKISSEFATPLISLKNRLNYLNNSLAEIGTPDQRTTLAILADETERLIQACAQLEPPSSTKMTSSEAKTDFRRPSRNAEAGFVKRVLSLMAGMAGGLLHPTTKKGLVKGQKHEDSQSEPPGRGSTARPA
jgi:CHASE3 domain sensor protein